jgi:hypothetical protein
MSMLGCCYFLSGAQAKRRIVGDGKRILRESRNIVILAMKCRLEVGIGSCHNTNHEPGDADVSSIRLNMDPHVSAAVGTTI